MANSSFYSWLAVPFFGRAVGFVRSAQAQRGMRPALVVRLDGVVHRAPGLCFAFQPRSQSILPFENPIHSLSQGVLRAMILLGHADGQLPLRQNAAILVGTILT